MILAWRVLFAVSVAATCYLTLTPIENPPRMPPGSDKVVHFAIFGINGLLALPAFRGRGRWLSLLGLLLLGGFLEVLQGQVPSRLPSLGDAVANWAGVVAAGVAGWVTANWRVAVAGE